MEQEDGLACVETRFCAQPVLLGVIRHFCPLVCAQVQIHRVLTWHSIIDGARLSSRMAVETCRIIGSMLTGLPDNSAQNATSSDSRSLAFDSVTGLYWPAVKT